MKEEDVYKKMELALILAERTLKESGVQNRYGFLESGIVAVAIVATKIYDDLDCPRGEEEV